MIDTVKAQWITALRSGEYEQANGSLHKINSEGEHSYCCLGVLCEIAVREGVITVNDRVSPGVVGYGETGSTWFLPEVVTQWAGLESGDPVVQYDDDRINISALNDVNKLTFDEIADVVESQL